VNIFHSFKGSIQWKVDQIQFLFPNDWIVFLRYEEISPSIKQFFTEIEKKHYEFESWLNQFRIWNQMTKELLNGKREISLFLSKLRKDLSLPLPKTLPSINFFSVKWFHFIWVSQMRNFVCSAQQIFLHKINANEFILNKQMNLILSSVFMESKWNQFCICQ
jgi:hypothetical protein